MVNNDLKRTVTIAGTVSDIGFGTVVGNTVKIGRRMVFNVRRFALGTVFPVNV